MQQILQAATTAMKFTEQHPTHYPELVVGTAPGMPCAIGWVYRTNVLFTRAEGTSDQIITAFEHSPLRILEGEALVRHAIDDDWVIRDVCARQGERSPLTRIIATGHNGEASILFESTSAPDAAMRDLRAAAIGRTLRRVVDSITTAGHV